MSLMSVISGATGLLDREPRGYSMMQAALPTLETESVQSNLFNSSQVSYTGPSPTNRKLFGSSRTTSQTSSTTESSPSIQASKDVKRAQKFPSFFSKSERFQKLVSWTFEAIDVDKSGSVDKTELYSGLILIHLKLAAYVGPAACRPASRAYVEEIFDILDHDNSGFLDENEFGVVITMLCSQILTRVLLQLGMTLLIVPSVALYIIEFCTDLTKLMKIIMNEIEQVELASQSLFWLFTSLLNFIVPAGIQNAWHKVGEAVPDEAYNSLPLTIVSCVLGMLLVPWMLYQIDEFYNKIATRKKKRRKLL